MDKQEEPFDRNNKKIFVNNFELKPSYREMLDKTQTQDLGETFRSSLEKPSSIIGKNTVISVQESNTAVPAEESMLHNTLNEDYTQQQQHPTQQSPSQLYETVGPSSKLMDFKTMKNFRDLAAKERIVQAYTEREKVYKSQSQLTIRNFPKGKNGSIGILTTNRGGIKRLPKKEPGSVMFPQLPGNMSSTAISSMVHKSFMATSNKKVF